MMKKESLKSHANRKIHKKIYSGNFKHKCIFFLFVHLCQIPKSYYKMKSRFGTKTVALPMSVPRSSWVQTRGMTILLLLFYQQKSFSSHKRRSNKNAYKHNRRHTYRHALTHSSDLTRLHLKWPNLAPKTRKPDQMRLLSNLAILFLAFSARVHDRHGRSDDSNVWSQLEVRGEPAAGQNNDYRSKLATQLNTSKLLPAVGCFTLFYKYNLHQGNIDILCLFLKQYIHLRFLEHNN